MSNEVFVEVLLGDVNLNDLVWIKWSDSVVATEGWEDKNELESQVPAECDSVGFVTEGTVGHITICQTNSETQVLGRMTIPAVSIQTIKRLENSGD